MMLNYYIRLNGVVCILLSMLYLIGSIMTIDVTLEDKSIFSQNIDIDYNNNNRNNKSSLLHQLINSLRRREIINELLVQDKHDVKRYKVVQIEFYRIETPFIIGLWILFASVAKIGFHMAPSINQKVPESCLLIFVGVVIGLILLLIRNLQITPLTPDTFFLYMLPPIILDAGYFMPNRLFFDNLGSILMFAVVGTIFNTLTIGASLWIGHFIGLHNCSAPLLEILLFASLISAVDPVAVLAVFEEIHVNEILYIVVFGESLLNDAITVVLYHMFEVYNEIGPSHVAYSDIIAGFSSFFVVGVGGTVIGVVWGFFTGFVTRFTYQVRVVEPIVVLVMAYLSYLNAELFHMSGILAITFCGITMKNYVEANISHKSHTTLKYTMKMLSSSSETIIFMFLGVSTVSENHHWNMPFVFWTIVFCTVYRAIGVLILTGILNKFRMYKINMVDKFVMSYGGLRGAVAFALALLIDNEHVKHKPIFITTTMAVIYFTVYVQGITIRPLVKILNVKTAEKRKPSMNERIHERFMDHLMAGMEDIIGNHGNHHLRDRFKRFDNSFIKPLILRHHQVAEPKILETYSKLAMKDAMEFMRRNASTLGNISNTGSILIHNCSSSNLHTSCSQLELHPNVDIKEIEYNPSKKDMTDARIHHMLAEELKAKRKKRRLSYSRHVFDEKDLAARVNYCTQMNAKRMLGDPEKLSRKRSKKKNNNNQEYPTTTTEVSYVAGSETGKLVPSESSDEDVGIVFTVKKTPIEEGCLRFLNRSRLSIITAPNDDVSSNNKKGNNTPTIAEVSLPWRRNDSPIKMVGERNGSESVDTPVIPCMIPTISELQLPWKVDEEPPNVQLQQNEYPSWSGNREYLSYNSPSSTFDRTKQVGNDVLETGRRYSSAVRHDDRKTFLSPHYCNTSQYRRGSMMELNSSASLLSEEELLSVAVSQGRHSIRSKSACLPHEIRSLLPGGTRCSSSSSDSESNL